MKTLLLAAALVAVAATATAGEAKTQVKAETVKSYEATTTAEVVADVSGTPVVASTTEVHTEHKTEVKTEKKAK